MGPFSKATTSKRWLLVGTNYFTKRVEVESLTNIQDTDVKRFVWKNIVTQFGEPKILISNNGLQFYGKAFRQYCLELGIVNRYSTPSYPQSNSQAKATNKSIINGLKKRLDDSKGQWAKELLSVLWAYMTNPRERLLS